MMLWLLKLRKVPLVGWLVAIIAVLIAALIWSVRAASFREKQLRITAKLSSAKKQGKKAMEKIEDGNALKREQVKATQEEEIGKLEKKRTEIRKAAKESNQKLADMVSEMFKK
jgi:hypothetical protein